MGSGSLSTVCGPSAASLGGPFDLGFDLGFDTGWN